ncbi:kunitz-type protease inhibitor 2 isoform X2 [Myripristis murdjan]|uniref:kunitz-type protease inhibitor 2 isoform X2 n=1 Tax=Myripristis murdjan TaxID=586833 RepID=UPI0011762A45|nr:papilin-like isoform X2 [Myripristis murdjan]
MMRELWCGLLVCLLVPAGLAEVCDWDQSTDPGQGLDPGSLHAGARQLAQLTDVTDPEKCREACCVMAECGLAVLGRPADGGAECLLYSCLAQGRDVCSLQPSEQHTVYRKKAKEQPSFPLPIVPVAAVPEPRNDTDTARCAQPMKVGSCKAAFRKFYYEQESDSCRPFIYGGCEANGNNFDSLEDCEAACRSGKGSLLPNASASAPVKAARMLPAQKSPELVKEAEDEGESKPADESAATTGAAPAEETATTNTAPAEETVSPAPRASRPEISADDFAERCEVAPKVGPCRASLMRWHYDSQTRTCRSFIYGGCQGNNNNYDSEESCMAACTVTVVPSSRRGPAKTPSPAHNADLAKDDYTEYCTAASEPGPCRAAFPMFFFNPASGTCQSFIYGGCRGNKNRYGTMEECMTRCAGSGGWFDGRGHGQPRDRWTPAFFLIGTLAVISLLLLATLVVMTMRRNRLPRQSSSVSDKEELLPDPDEQSSVESLSIPESPTAGKA